MSKRGRNNNNGARKFLRVGETCEYKSLVDGSLLRSARRSITDKNVHQIIISAINGHNEVMAAPFLHASNAFLIGIVGYNTSGNENIHRNHAVAAILTNGRLYAFNAHGLDSKPMDWLVSFLQQNGFVVNGFMQYNGPNLQLLDTKGACTAFSSRFLKLHPSAIMDQGAFDRYVVTHLTKYSLDELYKYIEKVASVRNVGSRSNSNSASNMNINVNVNAMNINRPRYFRRRAS